MPRSFYLLIHLIAIMSLFSSLGLYAAASILKLDKEKISYRKIAAITHGLSLLFILISGFGLKSKLGLDSTWPLWINLKIIIWVLFGAIVSLFFKRNVSGASVMFLSLVFGAIATYLGVFKI